MSRIHALSVEVVEQSAQTRSCRGRLVLRSSFDFPPEFYRPSDPVANATGSFLLRSRDGTVARVRERSYADDN